MRSLAPLLGAGGTFAGSVLLGFFVGVFFDERTGGEYYAFVGFLVGVALGAYGAVRLLARSL